MQLGCLVCPEAGIGEFLVADRMGGFFWWQESMKLMVVDDSVIAEQKKKQLSYKMKRTLGSGCLTDRSTD